MRKVTRMRCGSNGRWLAVPISLALTGLGSGTAHADAMRCDGRLVSVGDTALELRSLCGSPDHVATYPVLNALGIVAPDGSRAFQYTQEEVQTWTYTGDSGDMIRLIRIRRGEVAEIRTVSKVAVEPNPGCHQPVLRDRATTGEVHVACGTPADRARWIEEQVVQTRNGVGARKLVTHERWTYDPGPGRLLRIIEFENGRLVSIETGHRSKSR